MVCLRQVLNPLRIPCFPEGHAHKKVPHYLAIVGDFFVKLAVFQQEVTDLSRRAAAREKIGEVGKEALHRAQKENLTHSFGHYHFSAVLKFTGQQ